ncbi:MAG: ATP-binding cassette domain-containing protein, partial [Kineosporiaceae bacterium]
SPHTPESLMELVGLDAGLLRRRPARLSGGQRQRVAVARALAGQPSLLICDEAVSALDVSVQAQILTLLTRLRDEEGVSILFITHDLGVVAQISERIYVLNEGVVVETGDTAEVVARPGDAYTRRLRAASSLASE